MNKDNAKDYLPLVQALAEGKVIQRNHYPHTEMWSDCHSVAFNEPPGHYRIKPEPRKAWVWWPDLSKSPGEWPSVTLTRCDAQNLVAINGGHITEVTE